MTKYQEAVRTMVEDKLNDNSYGILFDVSLYNTDKIIYEKSFDLDDYKIETKRFVPVNITSISGDFLNIPDTSVLSAVIEMDFDIFVGDYSDMSYELQDLFKSVDYDGTMNAIKEFKKSILAKYVPLGDVSLMMGGEDSNLKYDSGSEAQSKVFYIKTTPYNTDTENMATFQNNAKIVKESTTIKFYYNATSFIEIPYTVNQEVAIACYYNGSAWKMEDNYGNTDDIVVTDTLDLTDNYKIGETTGYEGIVKEFGVGSTIMNSFDFDNIDTDLFFIYVDSFDTRYLIDEYNVGSVINNCILWGSEGNAIFGFNEIVPISDIKPADEFFYQEFGLDLPCVISEDVLFGNLFEYFIDDVQVFPIDRQHTWGAESNQSQKVNQEFATGIGESSQKDITQTFFYKPSKKLTKLLKQITSNSTKQNEPYELVVQYPFFSETYNVRIENGGIAPNINDLATFTLTFNQRDTELDEE